MKSCQRRYVLNLIAAEIQEPEPFQARERTQITYSVIEGHQGGQTRGMFQARQIDNCHRRYGQIGYSPHVRSFQRNAFRDTELLANGGSECWVRHPIFECVRQDFAGLGNLCKP